jgi:hypothetical protein
MKSAVRPLVAISMMLAASGTAVAQGYPSTTQMTCNSARAAVVQRGAIVLGTGGQTYDRVVRDTSFCFYGQRLRPVFAPTLDNPQCLVGDRCFDETFNR